MRSNFQRLAGAALLCSVTVLFAAIPVPSAAQAGASATPAAAPRDPLKAFQAIVGGYKAFFSTSRKLVYGQAYSDSPSGRLIYIVDYTGKDLSYDVRRSDSLVSPFTAYVQLSLRSLKNGSCGTVAGYQTAAGWPDLAGALAQADTARCFKPLLENEEYWDQVRFQYAYQDDKWTLVQILRIQYARPELAIAAAIGVPTAPGITLAAPQAMAFNKGWTETILTLQP